MEWELHKLLGSGSYGNVHLVRNVASREYAALKTSTCIESGNLVIGALRELFFYSSFTPSPGVCSSLGHWKEADKLHILMPFYPCTLESVYTQFQNALPFNDFIRLFRHSVVGLRAMHDQGYLHRDIKPENILVSKSGASLTDFNLMRWAAVERSPTEPSSSTDSSATTNRYRGSSTLAASKAYANALSPFSQLLCYRNSTEIRTPIPALPKQSVLKETASTYVCTLWTRAPELVKSLLEKKKKISYGCEIDIFSLGSTFLALAAGDFVLGKKCSLDKIKVPQECKDGDQDRAQDGSKEQKEVRNTSEYRYLGGFFKKFGVSPEITELYGTEFISEREWETSAMAIYDFIQHQILWSSDQILSVSKLLSRLLHPIPSKRSTLCQIEKWLEKYSDIGNEYSQSLQSFILRKETKIFTSKQSNLYVKIYQDKFNLPSMQDFSSIQFWSLCGSNFIPPFIACEVMRIKQSIPLSLQFSKALLYLLDSVHEFQLAENYKLFAGVDLEHVFVLAAHVKPSRETIEMALSLYSTPFMLCCLAAELCVSGEGCTLEELKKSKTLHLSNVKPFFEAYGTSWKSQESLRQTWTRLS